MSFVIEVELNHDALVEVVLSTFKSRGMSAHVDTAKTSEKLTNLLGGDDSAILALEEEES